MTFGGDAELRALLTHLGDGARHALAAQFVGLYLVGSFVTGDFDHERSDVDFVVVTGGDLDEATVASLAALHGRLALYPSHWARQLEGVYLPRTALRAPNPTALYPTTHEGRFCLGREGGDGVIRRHVLREWGVAVAGPEPRTLLDPVGPDALRRATRAILAEWWRPMLADPRRLRAREYQAYAVLTMCRMRYTLEHGAIVSKPAAARWARTRLGGRWRGLIDRASAWPNGDQPDELVPTLALIRATVRLAGRASVPELGIDAVESATLPAWSGHGRIGGAMESWRRGANIRVPDGELAWYERGSGPAVVFLHGGPGHDHRFLRPLAEPLVERFRCILPDQRGTGGSTPMSLDAATLHVDRFVEDVEALRAHLGEERLRLVGWSWGATLALLYSAAYPERVDRLAMVAPGPITPEAIGVYQANQVRGLTATERARRVKLLAAMDAAYAAGERDRYRAAHADLAVLTLRLSFFDPGRAEAFLPEYLAQFGDPFAAAVVERQVLASVGDFAHWGRIGESAAPALLIYGHQDFEPITQAFELREWLPSLRLAFLNECGHWPWLEQPERFYAALSPFLAGEEDASETPG